MSLAFYEFHLSNGVPFFVTDDTTVAKRFAPEHGFRIKSDFREVAEGEFRKQCTRWGVKFDQSYFEEQFEKSTAKTMEEVAAIMENYKQELEAKHAQYQ